MKRNAVPLPEDEHPFDVVMRGAEEFARQVLEERERNAQLPWDEDPLFKNVLVYDGPAPSNLSEKHDDYLYGDGD
jgi:hypothetical protein